MIDDTDPSGRLLSTVGTAGRTKLAMAEPDPFFAIRRDDAAHFVRFTRSATPFPTPAHAAEVFHGISSSIPTSQRTRWKLLVDMRAAPMRNDPEFEKAVGPINRELFQGYGRVAILVRTAVGRLQVQRVAKANGNRDPHVFTDEAAALAYLQEP